MSSVNYNVSVTLSVDKGGADNSKKEVKGFTKTIVEGFKDIGLAAEGVKTAFGAVVGALQPLYNLLIQSNEELNQNILKQQTFLAQSTKIFNGLGEEITNVGDKIDVTRGAIKEALIGVQRDTTELVGVTTQQVNEAFGIVVQNAGAIAGQFSDTVGDNVLQASRKLTKGVVAAIGTLGLGQDQVAQEFNALISGDLSNPDAVLAKTLKIRKEEFEAAKSRGELVDFLIGKLDVFVEANKRASRSIGGITSNLVSFVEDVSRAAGEPLLEPIIANLDDIQNILLPLTETLSKELGSFSKTLVPPLTGIIKKVIELSKILGGALFEALKRIIGNADDITGTFETVDTIFSSLVETIGLTAKSIQFLDEALGKAIPGLERFRETGGLVGRGLRGFGELVASSGERIEELTRGTSRAEAIQNAFSDSVRNTGAVVIKAKKDYEALSKILKEANDAGGIQNLTKEQQKQIKVLRTRLKLADQGLDSLRANIKEQETQGIETRIVTEGFFTQIDRAKKALEDLKKESAESSGLDIEQLNITAQDISDKLPLLDAFRTRFEAISESIAKGASGDEGLFQQNIDEIIGLSAELERLDESFTIEETLGVLRKVRDDTRVTKESRIAAAEAITTVIEEESQRRLAVFENESAQTELLLAKGAIGGSEATIRGLEIETKQIAENLRAARANLKEAQQLGSQDAIRQFTAVIDELTVRANTLPFEIAEARIAQQQSRLEKDIEDSQIRIENIVSQRTLQVAKLEDDGLLTRAEIAKRGSQIARDEAAEQLKIATETRKRLNALEEPASRGARRELDLQRQDALLAEIDATKSLIEAERDLEGASRDRVLEIIDLENQNTKLRLDNILLIAEQEKLSIEETEKLRLDTQRLELEGEKKLIKERLKQLQQDPVVNEQEILGIKLEINDIDRSLIQNSQEVLELAQQLKETDAARADLLEKEVLTSLRLQINEQKASLEELGELELQQSLEQSKRQLKLADAEIKLIKSRSFSQSELIQAEGQRLDIVAEISAIEKEINDNRIQNVEKQKRIQDALFERQIIQSETGLSNIKLEAKVEENSLKRIAQELKKLERQRKILVETQEEGLDKTLELTELENRRLLLLDQQQKATKEFVKNTLAREINETERKLSLTERSLSNEQKSLDLLRQRDQFELNSLNRQQSLLSTRLDLNRAINEANIQGLQIQLSLLEDSNQLRESFASLNARDNRNEIAAIKQILSQRGQGLAQSQSQIEQRAKLQRDIAKAEFEQTKTQIEQNRLIAEIQEKQAEISAKRLVQEAKLNLQTLKIEREKLKIELARVKLLPEDQQEENRAIIQEALRLQDGAVKLGQQGIVDAQQNAVNSKEIAQLQRKIRNVSNASALEAAENRLQTSLDNTALERGRALDAFQRKPTNPGDLSTTSTRGFNPSGGSRTVVNNFNFASAVNSKTTIRALGL